MAISAKIQQLHQARYLHFQNIVELLLGGMKQLSIGILAPPPPMLVMQAVQEIAKPVPKPILPVSQPATQQRPYALIQASYTPIPPQRFHTN